MENNELPPLPEPDFRVPVPNSRNDEYDEAWDIGSMHFYGDARASHALATEPSDTARLDWLDGGGYAHVFKLGTTWYSRKNYSQPYRKHVSIRAAIDAQLKD